MEVQVKTVIKVGKIYYIMDSDIIEGDIPDILYLVEEDDEEDVMTCEFVRVLQGGVLYEALDI